MTHFEPATEEELYERGYFTQLSGIHVNKYEYWSFLVREEKLFKKKGDEDRLVFAKLRREEFEVNCSARLQPDAT